MGIIASAYSSDRYDSISPFICLVCSPNTQSVSSMHVPILCVTLVGGNMLLHPGLRLAHP